MFKCLDVQMFKCSNVQMFQCFTVAMYQCSNVQMYKSQININKIKLLSERTSGVPLVVFKSSFLKSITLIELLSILHVYDLPQLTPAVCNFVLEYILFTKLPP